MADKVEAFVRTRLLSAGQTCKKLALYHVIEGRAPQTLLSLNVPRENLEDEIEQFSTEIRDTSDNHAAESSKAQRYQVIAYDDKGEVIASVTFRRRPAPDSLDPGESEPATPTGALALSMRLTESFASMVLKSHAVTVDHLTQENSRLSDRCAFLERKAIDNLTLQEDLLDRKQERDLIVVKEQRSDERKERLLIAAERIAVPLINDKLTGRRPVIDFLESLDDEQKAQVAGILKPAQLEKLLAIYNRDNESSPAKEEGTNEPSKQ